MLSSISWQQFLTALTIITVVYYIYVGLRYYKQEISVFVNRKPIPGSHQSTQISSPYRVMGVAKPDQGISIADSDELHFAVEDEPETDNVTAEHQGVTDTPIQEPTDELLNDVTHLIQAFKEIDDKPEFLSLLRIQYGSYHSNSNTIDWPAVKQRTLELTHDILPFKVLEADVQLI